jgi:hypothetical protein
MTYPISDNDKKRTSINVNCKSCNFEFSIVRSVFKKSTTKNFFCGHSCSAKYSNRNRQHTEITKAKITESLKKNAENKLGFQPKEQKFCSWCKSAIPEKSLAFLFCSKNCKVLYFDSISYNKEQVLEEIKKFFNEHSVTPSSKTNIILGNAAKRHYGSWNNAIEASGLPKNTQWMNRKNLKCKDGHKADSISEMLIDNWLFENEIPHERAKSYPSAKCNSDFYLTTRDVYVEYFGLYGAHKNYDAKVELKRQICKEQNLKLIELFPSDLYPKNKLKYKISF